MKIKLPKVNSSAVVTVATLGLGLAQMVLSNKKEATERAAMKKEIMEEIIKDLPISKES